MQLQLVSWLNSLGLPPRRSLKYRTCKRSWLESAWDLCSVQPLFESSGNIALGIECLTHWCWLHCSSQFCLAINNIILKLKEWENIVQIIGLELESLLTQNWWWWAINLNLEMKILFPLGIARILSKAATDISGPSQGSLPWKSSFWQCWDPEVSF